MDSMGKGKIPESNGGSVGFKPTTGHVVGRSDNPMVTVQPPRREDLQPSYAQTLVGESDQIHGWYGGMSKLPAVEKSNII